MKNKKIRAIILEIEKIIRSYEKREMLKEALELTNIMRKLEKIYNIKKRIKDEN